MKQEVRGSLEVASIVVERLTPEEAALAARLTRAFKKLNTLTSSRLLMGVIAFFLGGIGTMAVAGSWFDDMSVRDSFLIDVGGLFIGGAATALVVAGAAHLFYFRGQRKKTRASLSELWTSPCAPSLHAKIMKLESARVVVEEYEDLARGISTELLPVVERAAVGR